MAQKSLSQLENDIQTLRARLEAAEAEYKSRKDSQLARAATMLAKQDPAFKAALDKAMGVKAPAAASAVASPAPAAAQKAPPVQVKV